MPTKNFLWKSSRMVKSSKTCCKQGQKVTKTKSLKAFQTYLIISHESPREDAYLLVKWNLVDTAWQVGTVTVDQILEILAQANVEWLQVDLALDYFEEAIELIDRQVLDHGLRL